MMDDQVKNLKRMLGMLLSTPELSGEVSEDTEILIDVARRTMHQSEIAAKTPESFVGEIIDIGGYQMKITAASYRPNEKNAYAGGLLTMTCVP